MLRGLLVEGFREFSGVTGVQDHAMDGLKYKADIRTAKRCVGAQR